MSVLKGDYIGFTYNGIHSSELGIIRTSNGSRFDENLLPTIQDKTVQVPGGDGTYYFGSYYTQRPFNISFAFDGLSESQLEFLRTHFGDKKPHPLVFDECPYKEYSAKVTGTATIKYIPFDEGERHRLYKGEGTIQFTCYQPFAICKDKYLNNYDQEHRMEWEAASGMLVTQGSYDKLSGTHIKLYNPGVKGADWVLKINADGTNFPSGALKVNDECLVFGGGPVKPKNGINDTRITFNSKTGLIEGWTRQGENYVKSGNIYNDYITGGDFFKIPVNVTRGPMGKKTETTTYFSVGTNMARSGIFAGLEYDYYYL